MGDPSPRNPIREKVKYTQAASFFTTILSSTSRMPLIRIMALFTFHSLRREKKCRATKKKKWNLNCIFISRPIVRPECIVKYYRYSEQGKWTSKLICDEIGTFSPTTTGVRESLSILQKLMQCLPRAFAKVTDTLPDAYMTDGLGKK